MKLIVGIDYSISSPALTVYRGNGKNWSINQCRIFYITKTLKYLKTKHVFLHPSSYDFVAKYLIQDIDDIDKFYFLSKWVGDSISLCYDETKEAPEVWLEAYSYGSIGKHSQIAENIGILKLKLLKYNYPWKVVPPRSIKKFATGSGNATKLDMYNEFVKDTGYEIAKDYDKCNPQASPISDIVDSYFICKYGFYNGERI